VQQVALPTNPAVLGALRGVIDPELGDNVVDLGMVRAIEIAPDGAVTVDVALTIAGCPLRGELKADIQARVGSLPGVTDVRVRMAEMNAEEKAQLMARARWKVREKAPATSIPPTTRIVAVGSGKGGVGKSSVTVNLAVAVAERGYSVGLLDADIWGFSVPRMLGMEGNIPVRGTAEKWEMRPLEKGVGRGTLHVLSMGFLAGEDQAILWRGLLLNRAVQHFVEDVAWGDLDYLFIDMPPGTGDVQMGLARLLPRAEMVIVTTPALAAQKVAARAADMARKGYLRVAGVVENMSAFTCEHGTSYPLFGSGGGSRLAAELGVPLLGTIPLEPSVAAGGDAGQPAALGQGPARAAFSALADRVVEAVPPVEMSGCSARMLDAIEEALGPA
jgi:ATP-binding protein involved in chromosome partitioning